MHNNSSLLSGSRYCKPEVISWWKVNITVFYTRFLSPTDQKCAESSAFWQFFYHCPPSIQRERSLKCDAKNSTYIYWLISIHIYIYKYRYRYHPLDRQYRFSISVQPKITSIFRVFFFNVKKKRNVFQKLAGLWLLAKCLIMLGFMDLRWPRVARHSNVGLVSFCRIAVMQLNDPE